MGNTVAVAQRFGMVIDLDRCTGCGTCTMACAIENNVPPAEKGATTTTGIASLRVYELARQDQTDVPEVVFIPMMCQHCGHHPPCVAVCPQNAVDVDPETGIVSQIPQRCLGCRYCMTACPYHARSFNWWDPEWPAGMEATLNPDVAPRMRGVVEKCSLCHGRLHAAREQAALSGQPHGAVSYTPACVESCPASALVFGDLLQADSDVARLAASPDTFRLMESLGTEPGISYHSSSAWVRKSAGKAQRRTIDDIETHTS
jgi:menaquinone reductase, iron-sulfur cluster-binding subunit